MIISSFFCLPSFLLRAFSSPQLFDEEEAISVYKAGEAEAEVGKAREAGGEAEAEAATGVYKAGEAEAEAATGDKAGEAEAEAATGVYKAGEAEAEAIATTACC